MYEQVVHAFVERLRPSESTQITEDLLVDICREVGAPHTWRQITVDFFMATFQDNGERFARFKKELSDAWIRADAQDKYAPAFVNLYRLFSPLIAETTGSTVARCSEQYLQLFPTTARVANTPCNLTTGNSLGVKW